MDMCTLQEVLWHIASRDFMENLILNKCVLKFDVEYV